MDQDSIWRGEYLPVTVANLTVMALVAFDGLAIIAALPSIGDDLGNVALVPWIITAFLATSAVAGITAGPVIDAVGVRRTFRVTGVWFLATSVLVAVAPTMPLLVIARALQGIGGGLVIAVVLAGVGIAYPDDLRPRAFAANSMVWGTLGVGGPALVAVFLAVGSWRMVFLAQIPITMLALAMGWNSLPSTRQSNRVHRVDLPGVALVAALTVSSLVAVSQAGARWWLSGIGLVLAALFGSALWRHSATADDPVLAREHLTRFPLRRIHVTSGLVLVAGLAFDNYLPLYMRTIRGWSESAAAFAVLFVTVGWTTGAFIVSRALKVRTESDLILLGAVLSVPALAVVGLMVWTEGPIAVLFAALVLVGVCIGFISTSGLNLMQRNSAVEEMGRTNSAHQFIRTLSITYGVAAGGAILLFAVDRATGDVEAVRDLLSGEDANVATEQLEALRDGFVALVVFSIGVALLCVIAALALRRHSETVSGTRRLR